MAHKVRSYPIYSKSDGEVLQRVLLYGIGERQENNPYAEFERLQISQNACNDCHGLSDDARKVIFSL